MQRSHIISLLFSGLLFFFCNTFSQDFQWEENPVCTVINDKDKNETAIGLFINETYDYQYGPSGNLITFNTFHQKVKVIDGEQINLFNKIYISLANTIEITTIKARSINPDGSLVNFDEKNIKEIKEDENSGGYKIFAIDGIQKGADVEFLYVRKMYPDYNGRAYFQYKFPLRTGSLEVKTPGEIIFDYKVYNSRQDFIRKDTVINEKRITSFHFDSINAFEEVKYTYYNPLRLRVEYKLVNDLKLQPDLKYTWNEAAARVYNMTYFLTKSELKAIKKLLNKTLKVTDLTGKETIKKIEDYLKTNIYIQEYGPADLSQIDFILSKKVSNEQGMLRLMANIFKILAIEHEIVMTSDRTNIKFDGDFQSWNYLEKYLLYFPRFDAFLAPSEAELRFGFVPAYLTASDAMFIQKNQLLYNENVNAKIKYIPPLSYEKNYNNMMINIDIDDIHEKALIKTEMSLNGLAGGYLDIIYKYVEEDRRDIFLKSMMENPVGTNELLKIEVRDTSKLKANDTIEGQNFVIYVEYESASILEKAGNKYILNIGETIGEQVEMYQENKRVFDIENDFNRWFYREITLKIPEGYQIKNPDAIVMRIVSEQNGKKPYGFESSYTLEDSLYKVIINEYYKEIYTDKSRAEEFIKVVNAAADFNKVSLILEKK